MLSYCLKCKKDTERLNPKVSKTSNKRVTVFSKCVTCNSKKSRFIKEQEASRFLSKLRIKTPFSKIPLLGDIVI